MLMSNPEDAPNNRFSRSRKASLIDPFEGYLAARLTGASGVQAARFRVVEIEDQGFGFMRLIATSLITIIILLLTSVPSIQGESTDEQTRAAIRQLYSSD